MGSLYNEPNNIQVQQHVMMVSFPGQGHVNPLLRLAKRLAASGLLITLSTPEFMGQSIRESNNITSDESTPVGLGSIRFEFFDDEWAADHPERKNLDAYLDQLELVGRKKLPLMIRKHEELGRPVTCVINNPFIPWATDVADSLGIPSAMLWVQSCACFSAYYHFYHKIVPFPNENELELDVELPNMPLLKHDEIPSFLHPNTPYPFLRKAILGQFKNLDKPFCVLMDTFQEFEHEIIESMSKLCGPIKAIGPLFMSNSTSSSNNKKEIRVDLFTAENDCIEWLDTKTESSVVYISFGSIVHLEQEQVDEIAYGLIESAVNFLWVLRPPPKEKNLVPHVLPTGFMEKTLGRGKVVGWSPQEAVLAHPSTACFVTHCGWNSTLEAVASGVPIVAFPQWGDQVTNAKFLVDAYKVGIRMCRGEAEGRIVGREEVASCLKAAIGGEEVAEMKRNALRWKKAAEEAVADGGSSDRNMRDFVDEVVGLADKGRRN